MLDLYYTNKELKNYTINFDGEILYSGYNHTYRVSKINNIVELQFNNIRITKCYKDSNNMLCTKLPVDICPAYRMSFVSSLHSGAGCQRGYVKSVISTSGSLFFMSDFEITSSNDLFYEGHIVYLIN